MTRRAEIIPTTVGYKTLYNKLATTYPYDKMTKMFLPSLCVVALTLVIPGQAFSTQLSRREAFAKAVGTVAGSVVTTIALPQLANAEITDETPRVTTRMGGLLVGRFQFGS